jgi:DNA-binding response OmpR family regulator
MNLRLSQKIHLLVVDDDTACREALVEFFDREGFRVSFAASGNEAYQQLTSRRVDFSVMDVHMPGMTGIEVLRRLQLETSPLAIPPTVFMSSDQTVEEIVRQMLGLNVGFVPKPIRLNVLRESVQVLLRRSTEPPPSGPYPGPV